MVAWISLSLCLSLAMIRSMSDDLAVMTNNSRAVVHLLVCLLTVLGHNILTLLGVGGVHNGVVLLVALLVVLDVVLGGAVFLMVAIVVAATTRGSTGSSGQAEDNSESEHDY